MITGEQKNNIIYLLKCLLLSYIITFLILAVLAFVMLKLLPAKSIISGVIIVVYVAVNLLGGILAGRHMKEKRFLWGFATGSLYFAVLFVMSLLFPGEAFHFGSNVVTTFLLCAGGGMLGGMIS